MSAVPRNMTGVAEVMKRAGYKTAFCECSNGRLTVGLTVATTLTETVAASRREMGLRECAQPPPLPTAVPRA